SGVMRNPLRSYACEDCGLPIMRPHRPDRRKLCTECAIARVARNAYRRRAFGVQRRQALVRQSTSAAR
ncbi:MAG: hypothetical protein ACRDI2_26350, partial [Chloroflexota bacterium]